MSVCRLGLKKIYGCVSMILGGIIWLIGCIRLNPACDYYMRARAADLIIHAFKNNTNKHDAMHVAAADNMSKQQKKRQL
jgi:hypothetical protein